jgi:Tol biopolymer transport system component
VRLHRACAWLAVVLGSAPVSAATDGSESVFPLRTTRVVEFSTTEGTKMNPDVAPDGRSIVFDLLGDLYLLGLDGGEARPLSQGAAMDFRPRFSPDGTRIAFISDRNGTDNLWVMNADGSGARMVSAQDPNQHPKDIRFFVTPTWTADGKAVAASVASEITFYGTDDIRAFPVDPSQQGKSVSVAKVVAPDPATRPVFTGQRPPFLREGVDPEFSRDGHYLYYSARTELGRFNDERLMPQYQLARIDLRTDRLNVLTSTFQSAFTPRLSPDGRWMVYAARYDGDTGLRVRDLKDGLDRWLLFPVDRDAIENWWNEGLVNAYSFLPDSSAIVTSYGGKLWRVSVPEGKATPIPFTAKVHAGLAPLQRSPQKVMSGDTVKVRFFTEPVLSPDGKQLAFRALGRVWVKSWPNGTPRRVTNDADGLDDEGRPTWSANGESLLFTGFVMQTLRGGIYEKDVSASARPAKALTTGNFYYSALTITPDAQTIVALRAPVTRDSLYLGFGYRYSELARLPRAGGVSVEIAPAPVGEYPPELQFIAGDSSRVFYFEQEAGALTSVGLDGSGRREHLKIEGLTLGATGRNSGMTVLRSLLSADGKALIVHHDLVQHDGTSFGNVEWIDLSSLDLRSEPPKPAPVAGPRGTINGASVRRLTSGMGGLSPFWSADQREVYFSVADQIFRTTPDAKEPPQNSVARFGLTLPRWQSKSVVALRGARILTMAGADIPSGDIVIEGERIKAIGASGTVAIPTGAKVIDVAGRTIMPGIISTHAHQYEVGETGPMLSVGWELLAKFAYGVTTAFDPAPPLAIYSFSDLTEAGGFAGPRLLQTGPLVSWTDNLYSPADARTLVRRNTMYDDCCVKVYDMGGRLNRQWMWNAATDARRIPIPETEGSLNVSLSYVLDGVSHLAHGLQMPVYDDVRQLLGNSGSSIGYQFGALVGNGGPSALFHFFETELNEQDPRVQQWIPYEYWQQHNRRRLTVPPVEMVFTMYGENLARLMDAGFRIHLGEHGTAHGIANHWVVWAMARGAGNRRALEAATINGAYAMGIEKETGSLEVGKLADLLVLDANPLDDIRSTEKLRYVMRGGALYDPMTLARTWPQESPPPTRWWTQDVPRLRPGAKLSGNPSR